MARLIRAMAGCRLGIKQLQILGVRGLLPGNECVEKAIKA